MTDCAPKSLNVYVTARCGNACKFCTGRDTLKSKHDVTPYILNETLVVFPTIKSACIAGLGEPLLGLQIAEIIDLSLERLSFVSLITNGQHILDRRGLPYKKLDYISVSLNEVTPEKYTERCGSNNLEDVLLGIRHLVNLDADVGLSFVIGQSNLDRVPDYLRKAADLNVKFVNLVNTLVHYKEALTVDHTPDIARWKLTAADLDVNVTHWPIPLLDKESRGIPTCRSPFHTLGVDGDGSVTGCQRILGPQPAFGNVLRQGADCYDTAHFHYLRNNLMRVDHLGEPCNTCFGAFA